MRIESVEKEPFNQRVEHYSETYSNNLAVHHQRALVKRGAMETLCSVLFLFFLFDCPLWTGSWFGFELFLCSPLLNFSGPRLATALLLACEVSYSAL